mgnify:FL=1
MGLKKIILAAASIVFLLSACSIFPNNVEETTTFEPMAGVTQAESGGLILPSSDATITATPFQPVANPDLIYWSPAVPQEWVQTFSTLNEATDFTSSDLSLTAFKNVTGEMVFGVFQRVFAVVAAFPTATDNIYLGEIQAIWNGNVPAGQEFTKLVMTESTRDAFAEFWESAPSDMVSTMSQDSLVTRVWEATDTLALVPFEDIEPRFKVLHVDGISPLDRPMDATKYGLTVTYTLAGTSAAGIDHAIEIDQLLSTIPATNRDETKMTVVLMTGTTALARVTLRKIDLNGYEYPIELVKDWFLSADLRHVSNEVSFQEGCVYTDPYTMQFCSKPDQIKVLENIGINVVESTGNHMNDYPGDHFAQTLQMYQDRGWLNFGGGFNAETAKLSVTTEVNGNRIAFIGCNKVGFETVWATETRAGAAKCDYDYFNQQISELKSQGYVVIATFQYDEISLPMYDETYRVPFKNAANAGADIVQGSQAHVPMGFEFVGDNLIHYGLGNFLFDQMEPENIREFYDRHIIYDGKYIGTELLAATLTDWSRPVPMNEADRQSFLEEIFDASHMR